MQQVCTSYGSLCICSTTGKHAIDTKKSVFTAGEHCSKVSLSLFAIQYSDFTRL